MIAKFGFHQNYFFKKQASKCVFLFSLNLLVSEKPYDDIQITSACTHFNQFFFIILKFWGNANFPNFGLYIYLFIVS